MDNNRPAVLGVATTTLLAMVFTGFLLIATASTGDAVARPFVLLALYLAPAGIGWLGLRQGDPSLIAAAGLILIPASLLSFTGVTLVFLVPAFLLIRGAGVARRNAKVRAGFGATLRAVASGLFVLAAGWAVLFAFTESRCFETATGSGCSSAAISITGVVVGAALLAGAIGLAAWPLANRPDPAVGPRA